MTKLPMLTSEMVMDALGIPPIGTQCRYVGIAQPFYVEIVGNDPDEDGMIQVRRMRDNSTAWVHPRNLRKV